MIPDAEMGSKVSPYFILTAEKIPDPREQSENPAPNNTIQSKSEKSPPITPAPSASNTDDPHERLNLKTKKPAKGTIPETKRTESVRRRMDIIRERLEKSRERYQERRKLQEQSDIRCVPTVISLTEEGDLPCPLDRSASDLTPLTGTQKRANGSFPYVYFVVSQDKVTDSEGSVVLDQEDIAKTSRRRTTYPSEKTRHKKETQDKTVKLESLARELGLKSSAIRPIPFSSRPSTRPSMNHIAFPSSISPPRIPPCTPATTVFSAGLHADLDGNFFRREDLFDDTYRPRTQGCAMQTFELPFISVEQQRKALGVSPRNHKLADFAYANKPRTSHQQRKVKFAEALPVIKGSGLSHGDADRPTLGPRAVTLGSITLNSENPDKHVRELCQRFKMKESLETARMRKTGAVPLPLPKIDIVSNVYDEMVIKMIQEYLNDSNTPSRQAQLAKDLLQHLQQEQGDMVTPQGLLKLQNGLSFNANVPAQREHGRKANEPSGSQSHQDAGQVEALRENPSSQVNETREKDLHNTNTIREISENGLDEQPVADFDSNVPYIRVSLNSSTTAKGHALHREEALNLQALDDQASIASGRQNPPTPTTSRKTKERPVYNVVSPTSFKMAPPGLSREETNLSVSINV